MKLKINKTSTKESITQVKIKIIGTEVEIPTTKMVKL
jgi:hypothetical protein